MAITNPEAIRYCNEVVRPMAETFRGLKAEVDSALVNWNGGLSALFPADPLQIVEDGRTSEGVSRISGNDVVLLIGLLEAFQARLNLPNVSAIISRPTVRQLRAG